MNLVTFRPEPSWRLPLASFGLLAIGILATAVGLRQLAHQSIRDTTDAALLAVGRQGAGLLQMMQERDFTPTEQADQLRLLRETHHLDLILLSDAAGRLLLDPTGTRPGAAISRLIIDPDQHHRVRSGQAVEVLRDLDPFGDPILRHYRLLADLPGSPLLYLQKRDSAAALLAAIDRLALGGAGLGLLVAGLFAAGLHLVLRQRSQLTEQRRLMEGIDHVGRVGAQIAHEVKNPLGTAVVAAQSLACSERLDAEDRALLGVIDRSLARATRELEGLLGAVRSIPMRLQIMPVAPVIEELHDELAKRAAAAGVTLQWQIAVGACHTRIDPGRLQQAIANLVYNAIEATSEDSGTVTVTATCEALQLLIEVSDTGPGIDRSVRARLFTPFTTTKAGGMGLGLAGSRRTIEAMGGDLRLLDDAGPTRFSIVLPIASVSGTSDGATP